MYIYICYICIYIICIHIHKLYIHLVHWNCTSIGNSQRSDAPTAKPPPECSKQRPTPGTGHFAGHQESKKTEVTTCGDQTGAYLYYTLLHMYSIYVYIELYYHHYTDVLLSLCGMIYELVSTLSNS